MVPERGRRAGAERPPNDRPMRGGKRSGARAGAPADLAPRKRGACAGRSGRTEAGAPTRAERSNTRGGQHTPRRTATEGSGGEGGRGGGGRAAGPTRGAERTTTEAGTQDKRPDKTQTSARARGARPQRPSGAVNERRRAWRAGARATTQVAPRLWRQERARGDTQRPLIRERRPKGGAKRVGLRSDGREPEGRRRPPKKRHPVRGGAERGGHKAATPPSQKKGMRNPKPKDEARPSRATRSEVARAPRAPGAAPRRGEGTATKRSGSEATRKMLRAGQRAATRGRSEREAGKKGNGRNAQRTHINGRSEAGYIS
jgi:hypothetical protein